MTLGMYSQSQMTDVSLDWENVTETGASNLETIPEESVFEEGEASSGIEVGKWITKQHTMFRYKLVYIM